MDAPSVARVDSWIWAVRLVKTRSLATAACRAGHVRVNGERAKAAQPVRIGDEIRVREAGFDKIVTVGAILVKRVSATVAQASYVDLTPPPLPREETAFTPVRDRGAGRPTKRERRDLERLRARDDPDRDL
jgi:ribosome-associated heat shock protein Hsp15